MNTTQNPRIVRLMGGLCCLAVLFSYRPVTQAEEKKPQTEAPVKVIEESPAQRELPRIQPIFRTASYLQGKSILVPPVLEEFTTQSETPPEARVADDFVPPHVEEESVPAPVMHLPQEVIFDDWSMTISPANPTRKQVDPSNYNKIYQKIPFRRSEYLANPSYRHDATMEIMFGELRPTVNHRTTESQIIHNPRPQLYQDNQFLSNDYWRYHPPALRYFNRYLPMHY